MCVTGKATSGIICFSLLICVCFDFAAALQSCFPQKQTIFVCVCSLQHRIFLILIRTNQPVQRHKYKNLNENCSASVSFCSCVNLHSRSLIVPTFAVSYYTSEHKLAELGKTC